MSTAKIGNIVIMILVKLFIATNVARNIYFRKACERFFVAQASIIHYFCSGV